MKNISPAKPGDSEDCRGDTDRLRQECVKREGKTTSSALRVGECNTEAPPDDLAALIENRLLFAFRHCETLAPEGPAYDLSQAAIIEDISLKRAAGERRRAARAYQTFISLVLDDASWFGTAWKARLASRPKYRNPDALMYDAFMWIYEVRIDRAVLEWLRSAEFNHIDHAAPPEIWTEFKRYCARVADHLRKEGRAPIREMPFAIAPVSSREIVRGSAQIAAELGRSVRGTLRLIEGGKLPAVDTEAGFVAMRDALAPYRRYGESKIAA